MSMRDASESQLPAASRNRLKKFVWIAVIVAMLTPATASAQITPSFDPVVEQRWHVASWVSVLTLEGLDTIASFRSSNPKRALGLQVVRVSVVEFGTFALKKVFPQPRPCAPMGACGSDKPDAGWPSGHMSLGCSTFGGPSLALVIPLAAFTALGRWESWRHTPGQLTAGCLLGLLTSFIR